MKQKELDMTSRLTYASIPSEIKQIAKDSLGLGVLKSLFSYANTYHLMIKISEGAFIGFSLYHFETTKMSDGRTYTTGVIDCVCVVEEFRRDGFGTLLTFGTLRKMSAFGADRVELMLKTPGFKDHDNEPGVPLIGSEKLLEAMGFRKVKVFENHYEQLSKKYGYDCKFCGNRPDTCQGVLYLINGNADN